MQKHKETKQKPKKQTRTEPYRTIRSSKTLQYYTKINKNNKKTVPKQYKTTQNNTKLQKKENNRKQLKNIRNILGEKLVLTTIVLYMCLVLQCSPINPTKNACSQMERSRNLDAKTDALHI